VLRSTRVPLNCLRFVDHCAGQERKVARAANRYRIDFIEIVVELTMRDADARGIRGVFAYHVVSIGAAMQLDATGATLS
jgi:hypothetical protein